MAGKGLDAIPLRIPATWDPAWFETFVREVLALADIRNAVPGGGIEIEGNPAEAAVISADANVEDLINAGLLTVSASNLDNARTLVGSAGELELVDNGAGSTATMRIEENGIHLSKLRHVDGPCVLGTARALSDTPVSVIKAGTNDVVLARVDDKLAFTMLTLAMAADKLWTYAKIQDVSAGQRVLGNATGAAGPITELTLSQILDFIGSATEGDILYRGASGWERLPAGSDGQVLTLSGGVPTWADPPSISDATFVTVDDETATLPNSRQLLAGDGIALDAAVAGELTIDNLNPPP